MSEELNFVQPHKKIPVNLVIDDIRPIEPPKYSGLLDLETGVLTIYRDDKNGTADLFNQLQKKDGEQE